MNNPRRRLVALPDPRELKDLFGSVNTVRGFAERITLLLSNATRFDLSGTPLQETALFRGLSRYFEGSNESQLVPFVQSTLHAAADFLDEYAAFGRNQMFPLEAPHWECSRLRCRGILANSLLGNIAGDPVARLKEHSGPGQGLCFLPMYLSTSYAAAHKVQCILQYMDASAQMGVHESNEMISFDRVSMAASDFQHLDAWQQELRDSTMVQAITTNVMENGEAHAMVNFANKVFGVGRFASSCTQEEILQVCCPEINVGMLVHGEMGAGAAVVVRNARRYSSYAGYGRSFQFVGPYQPPLEQTIIFMDASITASREHQFSKENNLRDIRKAYLGFLASAASSTDLSHPSFLTHPRSARRGPHVVSTGKWGCGAFGGDPVLKFLQQIVAAFMCGGDSQRMVAVIFSSYRDKKLKQILLEVLENTKGWTPQDLLRQVLTKQGLFDSGDGYAKLIKRLEQKQTKQSIFCLF